MSTVLLCMSVCGGGGNLLIAGSCGALQCRLASALTQAYHQSNDTTGEIKAYSIMEQPCQSI